MFPRTRIAVYREVYLIRLSLSLQTERIYSRIYAFLQILLTVAVSIASYERSFSNLKPILSYLRALMGQERLRNLAFLSIEREKWKKK